MNLLALAVVVLFLGAPAGRAGGAVAAHRVCVADYEVVASGPVEVADEAYTSEIHRVHLALGEYRVPCRWQSVRGWGLPAPRAPDA